MPLYERADREVVEQMKRVLEAHHPGLRDAGVLVDVIIAKSKTDEQGQPLGPAIKQRGVVVNGYARIVGLKDRVMGRGDAEIVVDGDRWPEWGEATQDALFDHELLHLEVRVDSHGAVVRDDAGRPLLKMKPHDYEFGWFVTIAHRHGSASFEVQQAETIFTRDGQILFPFAAGVAKVERAEAFLAGGKMTVTRTTPGPGGGTRQTVLKDLDPTSLKKAARELAGKQPSA